MAGEKKRKPLSRGPTDLVAVDVGTTGMKVVRFKQLKDGLVIANADILPLPTIDENVDMEEMGKKKISLLGLPNRLTANYAAVSISGENSIVRLLTMPGHADPDKLSEAQVREQAALSDDYRIGYVITSYTKGKSETRLLVVAMPEADAQRTIALFSTGVPAVRTLEISGVSAMTAFLKGPGANIGEESVGVIETGSRISYLALFSRGAVSLLRKFDFGGEAIIARIQQQMGVDRDVAQGIVSDGSFDISQYVHEVMDPFLRQLLISRDFVERREDCRITRFYLSGGMSLSKYWVEEISNTAGLETITWNPFEGLNVAGGAYPEPLQGQEPRFTAAIGAGLGAFDFE